MEDFKYNNNQLFSKKNRNKINNKYKKNNQIIN